MTDIIAHRGAPYLAHNENSIESFEMAIRLGADMVEFDVRQTSDGVLIIYHNSIFDDTPVGLQKYEDIARKSYDYGIDIPTLEEAVNLCHGRIRMDIELKETGFERKLMRIVSSKCEYSEYMLKSFFDKTVYKIKSIDGNVNAGLLIGKEKASFRDRFNEYYPERRLRDCKADFVSPNRLLCTNEFLMRMKLKKYPVYVWTVNSADEIRKFAEHKVAGIITDKADLGLYVRGIRGEEDER